VIFDRLEGTRDPAAERTHTLTFTGPAVAKESVVQFAAKGVLTSPQPGVTDILASQADQGSFEVLKATLEAAVASTRQRAFKLNLIDRRTYVAWDQLAQFIIQLDGQRRSASADRTKRVDPILKSRAATAAIELQLALAVETDKAAAGMKVNPWTGNSADALGRGFDLQKAILEERWDAMRWRHQALVKGLDDWIVSLLRAGPWHEEVAQRVAAGGALHQLEAIAKHSPQRVLATFTPEKEPGKHVPLNLFAYKTDKYWYLKDLTNPKDPFEDKVAKTDDRFPPSDLFKELDWGKHFPAGTINYRIPGGRDGTVICRGKKAWYEWAAEAGLVLAGIGLAATLAGAGTVAAVALAAAGVAGAAAAGGDLVDHAQHGRLTPGIVILDIAQLVASVTGAGQVVTGHLVKVATATAARQASPVWTKLADLAGRSYVQFAAPSIVANAVTLGIMTSDAIAAYRSVMADPNLTSEQRRATLIRILGHFAFVASAVG
jgi:hypothetical protein